uniref:Trehalase n=2 Tax=Clastoptera arizonana TaxID=38151 RepID=A0A1B6DB06_9HEMI
MVPVLALFLYFQVTCGLTLVKAPIQAVLPPSCNSNIYCTGPLLHDVQLAKLYKDSKTFVDMKLRFDEQTVLDKYDILKRESGGVPSKDVLYKFVEENFETGSELELWIPNDFTESPALLNSISDEKYKSWAKDLNHVFKNLTRKVKEDVNTNPQLYSLLYVPNPFVIPGGRFLELYYWDSYWIVNGLLLLDMVQTAKGVIENFIYLVATYGLIPNGSRKYYLQRSQPPLLIPMVNSYYNRTGDLKFIKDNINILEKEFEFWQEKRMVKIRKNGVCYNLARYSALSSGPRPESYREDLETAAHFVTEEERNECYIKLKSAAESGFDFSTRWFIKDGTNKGNLSYIETTSIVPVDLNAFVHWNAKILSDFNALLNNPTKQAHYAEIADQLLAGITAILWREDIGMWFDYDLINKKSREYFYLSNFTPLWTQSYLLPKNIMSEKVLAYVKETGVADFVGGVPISLENSGEQWDFPNAWAPLEAIMIQGLENLNTPKAKSLAYSLADKWIKTNYYGWIKFQKMFEKYDVLLLGETGAGGEYDAQTGFGWTNGVCLEFLSTYGKELKSIDYSNYTSNTSE